MSTKGVQKEGDSNNSTFEFFQRTGIAEILISDRAGNITDTYVISKGTDVGRLVEPYQKLDTDLQKRLLGYLEALRGM